MANITVHHLEGSRSHRVLWLLEELAIDYELVRYERHPKTMRAPRAMREIHPLGKSPLVTVDGVVLAESGAILEHLVDTVAAGRLRPEANSEAYRRYRFFMHYAEGSFMPPLLVKLIMNRLRSAPLPFFVRPVAKGIARKIDGTFTDPEIEAHLTFLEGELADRAWFAGEELTAADVQMSYPLEAAAGRGGLGGAYPRLCRYLERIRERPAYGRAIARGGPVLPAPARA